MAIEYASTPTGMPSQTDERHQERRAVIRRLDDARVAVSEKTREAARYANRQVYGHPWTSVGIAFAAGTILGLLAGLALNR